MPIGKFKKEEKMSREVNMRKQSEITKCKTEKKSNACDMRDDGTISTDPFGSWTGVSRFDELEQPIQDVDDL